jgi:hypothetical protein
LNPPQSQAAMNCSMAKAKLLGMIVDRQATMIGSPAEFQQSEEEIYAEVAERIGLE